MYKGTEVKENTVGLGDLAKYEYTEGPYRGPAGSKLFH